MELAHYINPALVQELVAQTRDDAIIEMVAQLSQAGYLQDPKEFQEAILTREKLVSTGIGMGFAIPHARLSYCHDFFLAIGKHHAGLNWQAIDGQPVHIVLMIGGPDDRQTEYLQLLSQITVLIRDEKRRKRFLQAKNSKDLASALETN